MYSVRNVSLVKNYCQNRNFFALLGPGADSGEEGLVERNENEENSDDFSK